MIGNKRLIAFLRSLGLKVSDIQPAMDEIERFVAELVAKSVRFRKLASISFMVGSVAFNVAQAFGLL